MSPTADFTVSQLTSAVRVALQSAFPEEFWLLAEVQEFDRSAAKSYARGQVYFQLIEKESSGDQVRASVRAVLWGQERRAIEQKLRDVDPQLALRDGIGVRLRCRVDFYSQRGQFQIKVLDCDPEFTAGQWALRRERVLKRLRQEGLLARNKELELEPLPLRVGLITSAETAAYHDFLHEIRSSGFAFRVLYCDVPVQGSAAASAIAAALRRLSAIGTEIDVIVLIRGGGSQADLAWLDDESIARAIALSPAPVLTGIGHHIDCSIADEVAHTAFKTPTKVAQFLVERVRTCEQTLEHLHAEIASRAQAILANEPASLSHMSRDLARLAAASEAAAYRSLEVAASSLHDRGHRVTGAEEARLVAFAAQLTREAHHLVQAAKAERRRAAAILAREAPGAAGKAFAALKAAERDLVRSVDSELGGQRHYLASFLEKTDILAKNRFHHSIADLARIIAVMRTAPVMGLNREISALLARVDTLGFLARGIAPRADTTLQSSEDLLFAYDPQRILERGYAILEQLGGTPITTVRHVEPKMAVRARLRDGSLIADVRTVEKEGTHGDEKQRRAVQLREIQAET